MQRLRPVLSIIILVFGAYFLDQYFEEPPYEEFYGANTLYSSEQRTLFISFLKQENIPYRIKGTDSLDYHVSGYAKVRAFNRGLYGSLDYDSVSPVDSQMESLYRKKFEKAEIPYTVRMIESPQTMNFTFESKYNPQVDIIAQEAWLDWSERVKKMNKASHGYPQ